MSPTRSFTRRPLTRRLASLATAVALMGGAVGVAVVTAAPTGAQVAPCVATATPNPVEAGTAYLITVTGLGANDAITLDVTDPDGNGGTATGDNADAQGEFLLPQLGDPGQTLGTWTYQFTGNPSDATCTVEVEVVAAPATTTTTAPSTTTTAAVAAVTVTPAFTG